jgi:hypothetical protein
MYGRLRNVHVNVHGNDDEVRQDGSHDARDGLHASGLRRHVPDDDGLHDARLGNVREDVHDVRRNVHNVLQYVHEDGQGRDDDALRGNVQALRRVLQHDEQNVHGRLSVRHCIVPQSVWIDPLYKAERGVARSGCDSRDSFYKETTFAKGSAADGWAVKLCFLLR